jgi:hypothetical protein
MTALVPINDIQQMATAVAKSGLFGIKTAEQGVALMLIAQAEGLHPAIAARDYHIIQGRPALKADAMLARFQQAGGKVAWKTYTDSEVAGEFSHPSGGSVTVSWTIEQARKIGLASKDNWKNFPRAMLRARVVSEGIRTVYPGCVVGVYTPEEVQDFDNGSARPQKAAQGPADLPMVEEVVQEEEDLPVALIKPDGELYGRYKDEQEFNEAYASLVGRLVKAKLTDAQKKDKQQALWQANTSVINGLSSELRNQLRSLVAAEGGTLDFPKSQPPSAQEANESEF